MFQDKPQPSRPYVIFNVVLIVLTMLPLFLMAIHGLLFASVGLLLVLPILLLMLELFHAAYATEYRIEGGRISLRCGWIMNRRIPLADIQGVEHVDAIPRVLGWNPGALGYCNRFSNGLKLITPKRVVFISPSDPEAFQRALQVESAPAAAGTPVPAKESVLAKRVVALTFVGLGLFFIVLAIPLILERVEPNTIYGLRTPKTLSSPLNWYRGNYFGGICLLAAGAQVVLGGLVLFALARRLSALAIVIIGTAWMTLMVVGFAIVAVYDAAQMPDQPGQVVSGRWPATGGRFSGFV